MSSSFGKSIFKIFSKFTHCNTNSQLIPCRFLFTKKDKTKVDDTSPFLIERAKMNEFDEILQLMHESYYTEEPTSKALGITPNIVLDELAIKAMTEGLTLVARCKLEGRIIGAAINESNCPWDPDLTEKLASTVQCPKVKQQMLFFAYVMRAPEIFEIMGVQKIFEMSYLFVNKSDRKTGVAFNLLRDSKSLGADCGFGVIRCNATSTHTAKICDRLKMDLILEIPYCSYLGPNLVPVFKPPYPNEGVKIYCDCAPQLHEFQDRLKKKAKYLQATLSNTNKTTV